MEASKRNRVRNTGGVPPTEQGPQNYDVAIRVSEPETSVFYVSVVPECLQLSGHVENTITWTLHGESGAIFKSENDINFQTQQGKGRFQLTQTGDHTITGTVTGPEENQTIYTYEFTVHFPSVGVALRVDPEVDNPPPPPR